MSVITVVSRFVMELFYRNDCNESWFFENSLLPNLKSGYWEEMTEEEWGKMQSENRRAIDKCKRESQ